MNEDQKIQQQAEAFIRHLGLTPQDNYFTCYRYPKPILGVIPFKAITRGLIVKIDLLVFTKDELIVKRVGSGLSLVSIKPANFDKGLIRIPKTAIKEFEIKNWQVVIDWGYLMTVKADKTYYFNVVKTTGDDFSTRNFYNVKGNGFYGLVTDDLTE